METNWLGGTYKGSGGNAPAGGDFQGEPNPEPPLRGAPPSSQFCRPYPPVDFGGEGEQKRKRFVQ